MEYHPELFIVDEAHRTCVVTKLSEENSLFRSLLTFPARKYLFMTATEKVLRNDGEEEYWYSMNSKESYGDYICKKNFSEEIDDGIISDYRLVVVNSGNPIEVIMKSRQILGIKWLLTYHNSCESAHKFYQELNVIGITAFYIDGTMKMDNRMYVLKVFENTPHSVLCSVNVLAEGISLPFVDSTYFVDPKGSEIDIIQQVGRCLILHKEKSLATIILPENILEYAALLRSLVVYDSKSKDSIKKKVVGLGFSRNNLSDIDKFVKIERS